MTMPTAPSCYVRKDGRLALFRRRADAAYWDGQWAARSEQTLRHALRQGGHMAALGRFFAQWLPRDGKIVEAGCGTGIWVRRLRDRGYACIGLDYALTTLLRSKHVAPDLPLVGGDAFHLPFPNGSLAAYLSFGVVEHFEEGPQVLLREAHRVLRPGGIALVSVPYENVLRREAAVLDEPAARERGCEFYQYYFKPDAFREHLRDGGLEPQPVFRGYGVHMGARDLGSLAGFILLKLPRRSLWAPLLDLIPGLASRFAHMMFTVGIKR